MRLFGGGGVGQVAKLSNGLGENLQRLLGRPWGLGRIHGKEFDATADRVESDFLVLVVDIFHEGVTECGHARILIGPRLKILILPQELQDGAEPGNQVSL